MLPSSASTMCNVPPSVFKPGPANTQFSIQDPIHPLFSHKTDAIDSSECLAVCYSLSSLDLYVSLSVCLSVCVSVCLCTMFSMYM